MQYLVTSEMVVRITCRRCGRSTERITKGNELVRAHNRLKCTKCGHRGADLTCSSLATRNYRK